MRYNRFYHLKGIEVDFPRSPYNAFFCSSVKISPLPNFAPATQVLEHHFYVEALRLLENAIKQEITPEARITFNKKINQLRQIITAHNGDINPEEIKTVSPQNKFHKFLCEFSAKNALFLSPAAMLGQEGQKYLGDPMFIQRMIIDLKEPDKADRYVTFLNEIKQEYVLSRYLLAQSQFRLDELDSVDEDVFLIYPLDYSLHSVYIQLLKTALKQAISVLDKVAYFLYDYCQMKTPDPDKVSFLQLWGGGATLPKHLRGYENLYLRALFYLARDVSRSGDWNFIYEHRNALTHRFLVLHDMSLGDRQANPDIPRAQVDDFTRQVIFATKIARSAVMYLILFVELEEQKLDAADNGIRPTIYGTTLDKGFRHRPKY